MTLPRRVWAFERGTLWVAELGGEITSPPLSNLATVFGEVHRESAERLAAAMDLSDPDPVLRRFAADGGSHRRTAAGVVAGAIASHE